MTEEIDFSNFSLLDLFSMEVKTQVAVMNDCLLALEKQPQPTEELTILMRAAHSIKGAARIVQINPVVDLAHVMEDYFSAVKVGKLHINPNVIDVLLQTLDLFLVIADHCSSNGGAPLSSAIYEQTQSFIAQIHQILETNLFTAPTVVKVVDKTTASLQPIVVEKPIPDKITASVQPLVIEEPIPDKITANSPPLFTEETLKESLPITAVPLHPEEVQLNQNQLMRVSKEVLNQLMALAGESLVESKRLEPIIESLVQLKVNQIELSGLLEKLEEKVKQQNLDRSTENTLSQARQKVSECQNLLSERQNELELFYQHSANFANRLYRQVVTTRMCPFEEKGQRLPRIVRDLARQLNKKVNLQIIGKTTLVDRDILERLETPLVHILRNALDHGIESPQQRLAIGKPEVGLIQIEVSHRAGKLFITISDDGKGIEAEYLRQEIVKKKLTNWEMVAQLSEAELMDFLFLPGFSTSEVVTEYSGRGVGLDIVYSTVREFGGSLRAVSQPQQGMILYLQLPLTLSVIRTLLVEIAGEPYAFSLTRIEQVVMLSTSEIQVSENQPYFLLQNQPIRLVLAHQVLELPAPKVNSELMSVVVISDRLNHYGLVVDRFLGERNLVIKPLDSRLGKVPNISAAAILDDGSPVLIVDVEDLLISTAKVFSSGEISQVQQSTQQAVTKASKRVLVVDDSLTVREMERKLLENKGYQVEVAINGMDAWNIVRSRNFHLIVTDIDMPRMNGFELTNLIKGDQQLKTLPVVIVSYKDRQEDRLQGLQAGADYYLTKSSFHDDTLLEAVIDLIGEA
ncbi:MAG TPA: hybrid sensor histidine kinase/response regulator [Nostocaceae cyanobacterium]|nr:hybrid sensor histidine kinase/response regulator [Nostocaceae cyanobacterium]